MLLAKGNKLSEEQIVKGCKAQDIEMQRAFYQLYGPVLMGVCARYLKPRENAEEVFHDVVLKIFDNIKKYKGKGSFEGWCKRLTVNACLDFIRKNKNQMRLNYLEEQLVDVADTEEDLDLLVNSKLETLIKLMNDLPQQQQLAINLFVLDGYSHTDIANRLGISEGASRSLLQRAKLNLKVRLGIEKSEININGNTK